MSVEPVRALLTVEERQYMYEVGREVDVRELNHGAILVSKTGSVRRFDEVRQEELGGVKEYAYFEGGVHAAFWRVEHGWRDATELLAEHHPELPDKVFPEWV